MGYRHPITLAVAAVALFALVGAVAPARAATQVPFTITEQISPTATTFTATGPLCPSGTFEDTVATLGGAHSGQPKIEVLVTTVYTCDDGSGTFNMLKHVFLAFNPDGSSTKRASTFADAAIRRKADLLLVASLGDSLQQRFKVTRVAFRVLAVPLLERQLVPTDEEVECSGRTAVNGHRTGALTTWPDLKECVVSAIQVGRCDVKGSGTARTSSPKTPSTILSAAAS
jgi:hypothetical protein